MSEADDGNDLARLTVEARLQALEARVAVLERGLSGAVVRPRPAPEEEPPEPVPEIELSLPDFARGMVLLGRTLVVLGGAYLLRAVTEGSLVSVGLGLSLGLLYAVSWGYWMGRAAQGGWRGSASFHGVAVGLVGYPLIWEGTVRFDRLGAPVAAAGLAVLVAVSLVLARRWSLPGVAWFHVLAATLVALLLWAETGEGIPFASLLLLMGALTLWAGEWASGSWRVLLWWSALVADGAVWALSRLDGGPVGGRLLVQAGLVVIYAGGLALLATRSGRSVSLFEMAQTGLAVLVGYGGALALAREVGRPLDLTLAVVSVLLAAVSYAFPALSFHSRKRRNFILFTTLGLFLGVAGSGLLLPQPLWGWGALALIVVWLAARVGRLTLELHAALLCLAAATAGGLWGFGTEALLASEGGGPPPAAAPLLFVLVVATVGAWMSPRLTRWGLWSPLPQTLFLSVLAWGGLGFSVSVLVRLLGREPGRLAAARTGVLALAAVALAAAGRQVRFPAARWLVWPVLLLGGLKLVFQDFPHGRPATLFVALALYGGALIVVARWLRSGVRSTPGEQAEGPGGA